MVSLEQVQLLEDRVSKAVDYVKQLKGENAALVSEKEALLLKLEANQKRIDDLETHMLAFKKDQSRIEDGIIAALDRLSQFEEAFENSLKDTGKTREKAAVPKEKKIKEAAKKSQEEDEESLEYFELSKEESSSAALEAELDIF